MKVRHLTRPRLGAFAAGLLLTAAAIPNPAQAQQNPAQPSQSPPPAQQKRPNIIMLMTDDTGWNDFGAYSGGGASLGHPTPNVDQIAKEGAVFTNWYGQVSCTAGRASFITLATFDIRQTDSAITYIQQHANGNQPFFMDVNYIKMHNPTNAAPPYSYPY